MVAGAVPGVSKSTMHLTRSAGPSMAATWVADNSHKAAKIIHPSRTFTSRSFA